MPFEQRIPRELTQAAVQTYAPAASGVYGVSNEHEWVYIGETDDIRGALTVHLQEGPTPVMRRQPTGFVFEVCEHSRRSGRQDRLIQEYEPVCNRDSRLHT